MIDAYTIGITIALEDGVSAGIASIKQDLLALDRAIQASAAGLLALQRLGRQISIAGTGEPLPAPSHAPPATAPTTAAATPSPDLGLPTDPASTPATTFVPASVPNAQTSVEDPARPQSVPRERSPAVPAAPPTESQSKPTKPAQSQPIAPPPLTIRLPEQRSTNQTQPVQPTKIAEFAPRVPPTPRAISGDPSLEKPFPLVDRTDEIAAPVPQPWHATESIGLAPATDRKSSSAAPYSAAPIGPSILLNQAQRPGSLSDETTEPPPPRATAPLVQAIEDRSPRFASGNRPLNSAISTHPPSRDEAPSAGLTGDIMVDGSRLGRWMADALTKMAERAPSGSTGVDPRASPGWPAIQAD